MLPVKPDDLTLQALNRLKRDGDFGRVTRWLEANVEKLDQQNRSTMDGVQLRMGQGAAMVASTIVEYFNGERGLINAASNTRTNGLGSGANTGTSRAP